MGKYVGAILMDLSKASDCLPHQLLIAKLNAYNMSLISYSIIASYITNRQQRVKLADHKSSWRQTVKGVPQGSGLGPLIFNIFINDMFYSMKECLVLNYADDNTLYTYDYDPNALINRLLNDTNVAINWFSSNFMQANPSKFQSIFLKPMKKSDPFPEALQSNDVLIQTHTSVKLLGIHIDCKLNYVEHVRFMCKKAARQLNALKGVSKYLPINNKMLIYRSFILSNFSFCPLVWHFCGKKETKKIEKINERALRIVFSDYVSLYDELLDKSKTNTLFVQRLKRLVTEVYKCIYKISPAPMHEMSSIKIQKYNLRNKHTVDIPLVTTSRYGSKSFSYLANHIWNQMPNSIKCSQSQECFKTNLKTWAGPTCNCVLCNIVL